ncbi:hypothetical protein HOE04_05225 [archaeon]|jgi:hypothetical protein|nr:hypothetical protein [archaeon]
MVRKRLHEQITGLRKFSTNRFTIYYGDDFIEVMKDFNRIIRLEAEVPLVEDTITSKNRFSPTIRALIKMYVNAYWERNKKRREKEANAAEELSVREKKLKEEIIELDKKQYGDEDD